MKHTDLTTTSITNGEHKMNEREIATTRQVLARFYSAGISALDRLDAKTTKQMLSKIKDIADDALAELSLFNIMAMEEESAQQVMDPHK